MKGYYLFLDITRQPIDAYEYTQNSEFLKYNWDVVRSYDEFVSHIKLHGMPAYISFDCDISDTTSIEFESENVGYKSAAWLIQYCIDNKLDLPHYFCHATNFNGKMGLLNMLKNVRRVPKKYGLYVYADSPAVITTEWFDKNYF